MAEADMCYPWGVSRPPKIVQQKLKVAAFVIVLIIAIAAGSLYLADQQPSTASKPVPRPAEVPPPDERPAASSPEQPPQPQPSDFISGEARVIRATEYKYELRLFLHNNSRWTINAIEATVTISSNFGGRLETNHAHVYPKVGPGEDTRMDLESYYGFDNPSNGVKLQNTPPSDLQCEVRITRVELEDGTIIE